MKFNPIDFLLSLANSLLRAMKWHRDMLMHHGRTCIVCAYLVGFVMSYCDRTVASHLHADGAAPWPWVQVLREALREGGWRTDSIGADLLNGVRLAAVALSGPAMSFFVGYAAYAILLWAGSGVLLLFCVLQCSAQPDMYVVVWAILASIIHAVIVGVMLRRLREGGHSRTAAFVVHMGSVTGLLSAALGMAAQFLPMLLSALMIVQIGVQAVIK